MAADSARIPPSRVLSVTLPVKPSVTQTSTSSDITSRPSTLPRNRKPGSSASSA